MVLELFFLVLLLACSAFFSGAETSLTAIRKYHLHELKKKKKKSHSSLKYLFDNPSAMLATILLGNNLVNIALTALATLLFIDILGAVGIDSPTYVTLITTFFVTTFLLIFGEVTPKSVALAHAKFFASLVAPVIRFFSIIFSPFVYVLNKISSFFVRLSGGQSLTQNSLVTEKEILAMIDAGEDSGAIEKEEEEMMYEVIRFGDKIVRDVMTPIDEVMAVEENITFAELLLELKENPRSRIPVYKQFRTNIIGLLYVKDFLLKVDPDRYEEDFVLKDFPALIRAPYIVHDDRKVSRVLKHMRSDKKMHLAIVNNREEKTIGIVTIEDLIEEIIGEIEDEYEN